MLPSSSTTAMDASPSRPSTLKSVDMDTCPLLGTQFFRAIGKCNNLLELSLKNLSVKREAFDALVQSQEMLQNLQTLTLLSILGISDDILKSIIPSCRNCQNLDISQNFELTDSVLSTIREFGSGKLQSLEIVFG